MPLVVHDSDDEIRPVPKPKRIARRRDTFCEVIDTPKKDDGSCAIKIKITTNKAKAAVASNKRSTETDAIAKNAKKPKTSSDACGRNVLSRDCKVVLEKLNDSVLKRHNLLAECDTENDDKSVGDSSNDTAPNKSPTRKRKKNILNTDKDMHSRSNPTKCALCSQIPRHIVNHYINMHEDSEVFHARMPPETTDTLRGLDKFDGTHVNNRIDAICHYCDHLKKYSVKDWFVHITRHTGEYMHICNKCNSKFPENKCKVNATQCDHDDIGKWHDIDINTDALGVYVCKSCNYSQLMEENLKKHMRTMHSISRSPEKHYDFVELISNMRPKRRSRCASNTATGSEPTPSNSASDCEPTNPNVFESSEPGEGLFDKDTLQLMKDTTFKESTDEAPAKRRCTSKNIVETLSEKLRKRDVVVKAVPKQSTSSVAVQDEASTSSDASVNRQTKEKFTPNPGTCRAVYTVQCTLGHEESSIFVRAADSVFRK